jgi:kynurenine formamidase
MKITFSHQGQSWHADLSRPADLSIPLESRPDAVNCFWAPPVTYTPVVEGNFTGSTQAGGPVNFFNIKVNPHGNGTHTECVGHISKERFVLSKCLREYHFMAKVVSLYPTKTDDGDRVIFRDQLTPLLNPGETEALIIRTLPNDDRKKSRNYSGTNPPYLHHEAVSLMVDCGIRHLLLDLPSVDRESDDGLLLAHKAFWQYPFSIREDCTITELIYVPDEISDGFYLLNLQTAPFDLDASPSRPVIFPIELIGKD